MYKLLTILCASLFLTLLIGGRDYGQKRTGLTAATSAQSTLRPVIQPEAIVTKAAYAPAATPIVTGPVVQPMVVEALQARIDTAGASPSQEPVGTVRAPESAGQSDIRYVTAAAVNVRQGPSTRNDVIGRLTRGEAALVVVADENGWSRIRIEGDGIEGFVASRLLTDKDPLGN
jgi:uncharacterized protein YgiM (DUF1202 family)